MDFKVTLKPRMWIAGFFGIAAVLLIMACMWTEKVDPFFHYHKPDTSSYYYAINNPRYQNNGILRNFDYEGLIIGTSMTENFKTSEAKEIFGVEFVKTPFPGASLKEINDNVGFALSHNSNLEIVIRGIDMRVLMKEKDFMCDGWEDYPTYLFDDNPFNDMKYLLNRDVLFSRVYPMVQNTKESDFEPGITSFDEYNNWMSSFEFGVNSVLPNGYDYGKTDVQQPGLTDEEKEIVLESARQNITNLPKQYPDVEFYYFFTPYSALWWSEQMQSGSLRKQIEAERIVIEEVLSVENIKLFSINNLVQITADLNNYKDELHYASWINSLILKYMYKDICRLTRDNYRDYLVDEEHLYSTIDYYTIFNSQEDYENDYYCESLMNEDIIYNCNGEVVNCSY